MSSSDSHMTHVHQTESNEVKPCLILLDAVASSSSSSDVASGSTKALDDDDIHLPLIKRKLTTPSTFPSRRPRFALQSRPHIDTLNYSESVISGTYSNNFAQPGQDVRPSISALSASFNPSSSGTRNVNSDPQNTLSSNNHLRRHGLTDQSSTHTKVFTNTTELAAHYGFPTFLPPRPATQPQRRHTSVSTTIPEYQSLSQNYLTMLGQNSATAKQAVEPDAFYRQWEGSPKLGKRFLLQILTSSSESDSPDMPPLSEYFTSPIDDSPLSDFLATPLMEMNTSPALEIYNHQEFPDQHGLEGDFDFSLDDSLKTVQPYLTTVSPSMTMTCNFPSPSHLPTPLPTSCLSQTRVRKTNNLATATGTRKNVTPATLVPIDAPTQPRRYVAPSATSRKELPVGFARKRARAHADEEAEGDADELDEYQLPPNPTEQQLIEAKRRQNTVAARRSRKRKLEHQRALEEDNAQALFERDTWKNYSITLEALLHSHGITAPAPPLFDSP